jgi:transcriptional regulator with XRE-family HTH domain
MTREMNDHERLFKDILKRERQRRSFSQSEIAKKIGIDTNTISRWERGTHAPKQTYVIRKLCSLFDMSAQELGLFNEELAKTLSTSLSSTKILTSGNVEFEAIEPSDIVYSGSLPVIAQALDNQWVPHSLLKSMLRGKISYTRAAKYLERLVRTEYIRALLNGEQLVINRAFLYNNPQLFQDYLLGQSNRQVFKEFLANGVIIPFLMEENSPDAIPAFETIKEGFSAWQQICQEVRTKCIRFSWKSDVNQQYAIERLSHQFHDFALTVETKNIPKLLIDLGLDQEAENALRNQLELMSDISKMHFRDHNRFKKCNPYITRNILYKEFVTIGDNPADRLYDGTKIFAGEIKQLLDLAYNTYFADALGGYLLTPTGSPSRLVLQELESAARIKEQITADKLINMLRSNIFALIGEGLYLKSMDVLSLQDVQEIRKMEEWIRYIVSLKKLLKQPTLFADLAADVYFNYIGLAKRMTVLIEQRNSQRREALITTWEPSIKIIARIGGASLSVIWNKDGTFYGFAGEDTLSQTTTISGTAPFSMKLIIGEGSSRRSHMQAKLFTSIDILQGKMLDAQEQWKEIMHRFREDIKVQEYSPPRVKTVAVPTINSYDYSFV